MKHTTDSPVLDAAGVFNVCKLKTHTFMGMTGAVKNAFGVIPALTKPGYHAKLKDTGRFADMLLDLALLVSPRVSLMDALVAMEGDGPAQGDPRHVGMLLASRNPLALDLVASEIIGLPREMNPLLIAAGQRGLEPTRLDQVKIVGAKVEELRVHDFKLPATMHGGTGLGGHMTWWQLLLEPLFEDSLSLKPHIVREQCVACGACEQACPVEAITLVEDEYASIDLDRCIRCYCCHEMCAEHAVALRPSILYRIFNRHSAVGGSAAAS